MNLVKVDYCDDPSIPSEWELRDTGYYAAYESAIAVMFGIVPQLAATLMLLIAGVEYIMWSGSKIGSDTLGNEEIILATVAIAFINDIDDFMYANALRLPELYKTAHELDLFNLPNWIQSDEPMELCYYDHAPPESGRFSEARPRPGAQDPSGGVSQLHHLAAQGQSDGIKQLLQGVANQQWPARTDECSRADRR
jgi:hypothetical protein